MFQLCHHGINVPKELQPKCKTCGGGMTLNISFPNNECIAFWYCLEHNHGFACNSEVEQVQFQDWYNSLPDGDIKNHFSSVGKDYNQMVEDDLLAEGYIKVGGHIWGGGTWGKLEGEKAWTGYKGQVLEYWVKDQKIYNGESRKDD